MDASVHLMRKKAAGGRGKATTGEPVLATLVWGMLYEDEAGVVLQSPEKREDDGDDRSCVHGVWSHVS